MRLHLAREGHWHLPELHEHRAPQSTASVWRRVLHLAATREEGFLLLHGVRMVVAPWRSKMSEIETRNTEVPYAKGLISHSFEESQRGVQFTKPDIVHTMMVWGKLIIRKNKVLLCGQISTCLNCHSCMVDSKFVVVEQKGVFSAFHMCVFVLHSMRFVLLIIFLF